MGYINAERIVRVAEDFVKSLSDQKKTAFAPGYFHTQVSDIGRAFDKGEIKKEDLAEKISTVLKNHKVYLDENSEMSALRNLIKKM